MSKIAIISGSGLVDSRLIELMKKDNTIVNIDKQESH